MPAMKSTHCAIHNRRSRHGPTQLGQLGAGAQMTRCAVSVGYGFVRDDATEAVVELEAERPDTFELLLDFCAGVVRPGCLPGVAS